MQEQLILPQRFQAALDAQASREDRQGFLVDLFQAEALPRVPPDQRVVFCHVGAGRCHLTRRISETFESSHVVEPNSYQLPCPEDISDLAVHTNDVMLVRMPHGEQFAFILCDHLLNSLATSSARADLKAYLHRLLGELLKDGGVAVLGTIAPRGPLHEFLAAINPAYVGSAAVQAALGELPGEYDMWVVEHSNVHSLASRAQLEGLLELHAYLVEPQAGAEVPLPAAGAPAPAPAGPAEEAVAAGRVAELIRQFVEDAYDGQGRWNWVEEDDYILVQKLPLAPAAEV